MSPTPERALTVRLAELGELRDDELAALRDRSIEAKLRSAPRVSACPGAGCRTAFRWTPAVELFEAAQACLRAGRGCSCRS